MKKSGFDAIFSRNLRQTKSLKIADIIFFVFKRKINNIFLKILLNFIKISKILVKNSGKKWMRLTEFTLFSQKFKPRYLPFEKENQKKILIPYSTLDKLSNDTSLNSLRWIYRSAKIDWTKKTHLSI